MRDAECVQFLQWALPRLEMRWPGFRKVRRQVCKRVGRRIAELELETIEQYRERLRTDSAEWRMLDGLCRITVSRFYRDRHVFDILGETVLPALAVKAGKENRSVRCWSAGCASGEEAYTLAILWDVAVGAEFPDVGREIIGTDADPVMIARAERACYPPGSFKDMPEAWRQKAFEISDGRYCVAAALRQDVTIVLQDIREAMPEGPFDLVLCRNLAFTYFTTALQRAILGQIKARLRPTGYLVIGAREALPQDNHGFEAIAGCRGILVQATG
ncbi:MAG: CheR family methyltransferase [Kiloniellales bacterium]